MAQLYFDCDGVLADFDSGAERVLGLPPREFKKRYGLPEFWKRLAGTPDFHASLPLMPDAGRLFETVRHLDPIILTGCPRGGWAEAQKVRWAAEHFPGIPIITCMAIDKPRHAHAGDILVDDTLRQRHRWEAGRGIFVHHVNAKQSLTELLPEALPAAA
jgi:hypothetical protein